MHITRLFFVAGCLAAAAGLSACDRRPEAPEPVRAVKLETVGIAGAEIMSRYVAIVRQQQRAELAFESGGRMADITVDVGDHVRRGQILARLDPERGRLRLAQAEANLRGAAAQLQERQMQMRQQQAMFDDGSISEATLTGVRTAQEAAQAQLLVAQADRDLVARAQRLTELRSPFDGSVVARMAQPQSEVASGQNVLQIEGQGHAQAIAIMPPARAAGLHPGDTVQAAASDGRMLALRLNTVSARLESGATVQAIFDLLDSSAVVRSGDSLLLGLPAAEIQTPSVPLAGVLPATHGDTAKVFVYQPVAGAVRRRDVRLGKIEGERVQVLDGLHVGEQVVGSGVAFLVDGQKVMPYPSSSHLSEGGTL